MTDQQIFEATKRFDLTSRGLNIIAYISDTAMRMTHRQAPLEADVAVCQMNADGEPVFSFIGTKDRESNRRLSDAVRTAASQLLKIADAGERGVEFDETERTYLQIAATLPAEPPLPSSAK